MICETIPTTLNGSHGLVDTRPDLFDGVTEAIGEVGGLSLTVPRPDGSERRLYLIETAEKGIQWMRLTARGQAGHGSMVNDQNAVTAVSSTPWTDTPLCCTCQPTNGAPSYSITSL